MRPVPLISLFLAGAALAILQAGCGGGDDDATPTASPTTTPTASSTGTPGGQERASLEGTLTLDGAPFDAPFLGVRVIRDGLVAACQDTIPTVAAGAYTVPVAADAEVRGCGAPGGEMVLWVFVDNAYFYSSETAPWPGDGGSATFDATFSSAAPAGATDPVTEFKGLLFDREGRMFPGGTVVEAYVDETLCGITSLRYGDVTEGYFTLIVAGPEMIAGCSEGATLQFRVNGEVAAETALHDLGQGSAGHEVNLSLR